MEKKETILPKKDRLDLVLEWCEQDGHSYGIDTIAANPIHFDEDCKKTVLMSVPLQHGEGLPGAQHHVLMQDDIVIVGNQ